MSNRVRQARTAKNWTREELAEKSGVMLSTIRHCEEDSYTPGIRTVRKLSQTLGVREDKLFFSHKRNPQDVLPVIKGGFPRSVIREWAGVNIGDKMLCRMTGLGDGPHEHHISRATVVERKRDYFRVKYDRAGFCECWSYYALLTEDGIRKAERR